MKKIIGISKWLIASTVIVLASCGAENTEDVYPTDLEGQTKLLIEKKKDLKELEDMIAKLEADIEDKDPSVKNFKKVTTKAVERQDIERFVQVQGSVVADDYIMASAEVGGRLLAMNIEEGDNIRRGQRIASVDMESLRKQIEEIQTSLDLAQEVYTRQERLWKQNIGSEMQYLQAKNNRDRLIKSQETLRYNLTKGDIVSPASGVVEKVMLRTGEMAGPGSPILQILNVNKVKISIDVPEKHLKKIRKGSRLKIELPTLEYEKTIRVTDIGRMIDPANRTFKVEADISSNGGKIKPNLMAIAHILDYELKDAVAIESELIQQDIDGSSFVFTVEKNEEGGFIVKKQYIEIGESIDNLLIVTSGLTGDEALIVDGARIINAGQEVIIENATK